MNKQIKSILGLIGLVLFFVTPSMAKKQFVPIINDDILTMASYYTSTNNLIVPTDLSDNDFKDLLLQCEDDITYFLMAYMYYDEYNITASVGEVMIDEYFNQNNLAYIKGYIEGNESVSVTGTVYNSVYNFSKEVTKTCNRSNISSVNTLQVPTFNGNSQGKMVIQCEDDVVYYIMAYDCLRQDTRPSVTTNNGIAVSDPMIHVGEVFYVKGHVERKNTNPVTIMGHVYSGGQVLYRWPNWTQTCP